MKYLVLLCCLLVNLVIGEDYPFESMPYVNTLHVDQLANYGVDTDNASKLISDCYLDNRKMFRSRFEENANLAIQVLKLDPEFKKDYIGIGVNNDILSTMDIICSGYTEYDIFVAELKTVGYRYKDDDSAHSKFMDALSMFIVTEFANVSEEVDGEF